MTPSTSPPPRRRERATLQRAYPIASAVVLALGAACGTEAPVSAPASATIASIVPQPAADLALAMPSRVAAAAIGAACGVEPQRPFDVAPSSAPLPSGALSSMMMATFLGPAGNPSNPLLSTTSLTLLDLLAVGGTASGGGASAYPTDVNGLGQIVGYSGVNGAFRAYVWKQPTGFTSIAPLPGDAMSLAMGTNDAGLVVGYSLTTPLAVRAFTYSGGTATQLGPAFSGSAITYAMAVGNSGHIVGYGRFSPGVDHAWRHAGVSFQDLGVPAGYTSSYATAVSNDGGSVAGYVRSATAKRPALWQGSGWTVLALPAGYDEGEATGVNASGKVVGWMRVTGTTTQFRGFYFDGATMHVVPTLGGTMSRLWAINDAGLAAGYGTLPGDLDTHAIRYAPGTGVTELGKQVGACSSYGYAITPDGDVVGNNIISTTYRESVWPIDPPARYSLGDRVWTDVDGNAAQDAGEPGINGATLTLYDAANAVLGTTTTAGDGQYSFPNLLAGSYKVCVTAGIPAGLTQTYDLTAPMTDQCATASVGPSRTDVDFGYTPPRFTLGDLVWNDVDASGGAAQGAGEPGIGGVTLSIAGPAGYSATTTTAANGSYSFANLLAGSYTVCVASSNMAAGGPLAGYAQTYDLDGIAAGSQHCATASVGPSRADVDFSYTPPRYSLGDRVWTDANGNAAQDAGETGINGVTVTVTNAANAVVGTATTAGDGQYTVGNLPAGTYKVCVTAGVPAGMTQTYDLTAPTTDHCATASVGPSRTDVDFGYWMGSPPSLGAFVLLDGTCSVKPSITFTATDSDGPAPLTFVVTWSDATSASGSFTSGVPVTVEKAAPYANGSYTATVTVRDGNGQTATATRTVTYACVGSVGDFAWIDANGNGKQDAGEPGLAGVKLTLGGAGSGSQTTTASGAYLFGSLAMGSYTVTATAPAGWLPTIVNAPGTNGANDSNGSPASATLTAASPNDLTLDFGFVPAAGSGQGCTPGYWKQKQHFDSWKWYGQSDLVDVVFGLGAKPFRSTAKNNPTGALTLLQALELNGNGGGEQLFRHGTAALLNSVYQSGVSYPYTAAQVITMVRTAWLSGDAAKIDAAHSALGAANEKGCPLN